VNLQVGQRPLLVEHTQRRLAGSQHGLGLGPTSHGRDQQVVAIDHVVDDRNRRRPLLALEAEDAGAVVLDEGPALLLVHHVHFSLTEGLAPRRVFAGVFEGDWPTA